jgi:hypothetical protein
MVSYPSTGPLDLSGQPGPQRRPRPGWDTAAGPTS